MNKIIFLFEIFSMHWELALVWSLYYVYYFLILYIKILLASTYNINYHNQI